MRHFDDVVDPDHVLPPEERSRRAENARRAYMAKLALKSAKARRLRAEADQLEVDIAAAEHLNDEVLVEAGQREAATEARRPDIEAEIGKAEQLETIGRAS
jgi:hypothetical protein